MLSKCKLRMLFNLLTVMANTALICVLPWEASAAPAPAQLFPTAGDERVGDCTAYQALKQGQNSAQPKLVGHQFEGRSSAGEDCRALLSQRPDRSYLPRPEAASAGHRLEGVVEEEDTVQTGGVRRTRACGSRTGVVGPGSGPNSQQSERMLGRLPGARRGMGALDLRPLNLSPAQKEKVRALRKEAAPRARQIRQLLKARRQEIKELMFNPDATEADIRAKIREVHRLQAKQDDILIENLLSVRSLLTLEQRRQWSEMRTRPYSQPGSSSR